MVAESFLKEQQPGAIAEDSSEYPDFSLCTCRLERTRGVRTAPPLEHQGTRPC